jgi:nucleotide-binding universal stress UspA family protein
MRHDADLRVLLTTSVTAGSVPASHAVAQLASHCPLHVTFVDVVKPGDRVVPTPHALHTFMAGAGRAGRWRRLLLEGEDPAAAVTALCAKEPFDLIMTPAPERRDLHSLFRGSFRVRLLKACPIPLWTAGAGLPASHFVRRIGTVGCFVRFDEDPKPLVDLASAFAARVGARLRILAVIPPVDDRTLTEVLTSDAPLSPGRALARIQEMLTGWESVDVDVEVGERGRQLRRILARRGADLLFVSAKEAAAAWAFGFSRDLDRVPCPVVCADGAAVPLGQWSLASNFPGNRRTGTVPKRHLTLVGAAISSG